MNTSTKAPAQATNQEAAAAKGSYSGHAPIVIDMGKKSRKAVRKLRKGKDGRLMRRVEDAVEHLKENGAVADGTQVIVVVVKQKPKRRGKRVAKMWGLG